LKRPEYLYTVKELIGKASPTDTLHEQARKEEMLTMMEDGIYKAAAGITTLEEVNRVTATDNA
jgi:type II secretory ATPase GspE/PulE/Tfp pilus assembly ATPase PilB-like protein